MKRSGFSAPFVHYIMEFCLWQTFSIKGKAIIASSTKVNPIRVKLCLDIS